MKYHIVYCVLCIVFARLIHSTTIIAWSTFRCITPLPDPFLLLWPPASQYVAGQVHSAHALADCLSLVDAYSHLTATQARVACLENLVSCPPLTSELVFCR